MNILRRTVKSGLLGAVGNKPDYKIQLLAAGWCDKGVLTEDDLNEINTAIEENKPIPEPTTEEA